MMAGSAWRANTPEEQAMRGCVGKVQYRTEEWAREMRRRCERERGKPLRIYRCSVCQLWHLTSFQKPQPRCGVCLEPFEPAGNEWTCEECR